MASLVRILGPVLKFLLQKAMYSSLIIVHTAQYSSATYLADLNTNIVSKVHFMSFFFFFLVLTREHCCKGKIQIRSPYKTIRACPKNGNKDAEGGQEI